MLKLYIAHLIISMGLCAPVPCTDVGVAMHNAAPDTCGTTGFSNIEYMPRQMMCMAKVIENNDGVVFFDTFDGNGWVVKSNDNIYEVGKTFIIMFDTKLTDDIYDDEIINIMPSS